MYVSAKPQRVAQQGHVAHLQHQEAQLQLTGSKKDQEKNANLKNGRAHFVDDSVLPNAVSGILT